MLLAVQDYIGQAPPTHEHQTAKAFLFDDHVWFPEVCSMAGADPEWIRRNSWKIQQSNRRRVMTSFLLGEKRKLLRKKYIPSPDAR